jgi:hypothetical protein
MYYVGNQSREQVVNMNHALQKHLLECIHRYNPPSIAVSLTTYADAVEPTTPALTKKSQSVWTMLKLTRTNKLGHSRFLPHQGPQYKLYSATFCTAS